MNKTATSADFELPLLFTTGSREPERKKNRLGFFEETSGAPRTRKDEIETARKETWSSMRDIVDQLIVTLEKERDGNFLPLTSFAACDLETLLHLCMDENDAERIQEWGISEASGLKALREYTGRRILEGAYVLIDEIAENTYLKKLTRARDKSTDLHLAGEEAWLPLIEYLRKPAIHAFMEEHDVEGMLYDRVLRYIGKVSVMPPMELAFWGPSPAHLAHLTSTDMFEDAMLASVCGESGFFGGEDSSYRSQWPYEMNQEAVRVAMDRVVGTQKLMRERWSAVYPALFENGSPQNGSSRFNRSNRDSSDGERMRFIQEHYRELEEMVRDLQQRQAILSQRQNAIGGKISLVRSEDRSIDVIFEGRGRNKPLSMQRRFLADNKAKMYVSNSDQSDVEAGQICISKRDLLSPHIVILFHEVAHARHRHHPSGLLEYELLMMQMEEDETKVSMEEYIALAQRYATQDAANERDGHLHALEMMRIVRGETGMDLRNLFGNFEEFREHIMKPYAELDSNENENEWDKQIDGHASYVKGFFKGEKDTSIFGFMDQHSMNDGGERRWARKICDALTEEQIFAFEKFVDEQFDVTGMEKELWLFWNEQ